MCFKRAQLDDLGVFRGLNFDLDKYDVLKMPHSIFPMERAEVETSPFYVQPIPYVVILDHLDRVLRYRRGKVGQESRLHGLHSIGVGGHVSEHESVELAMERELFEEIGITLTNDFHPKLRCFAYHQDQDEPIGQFHFGFIYVLKLTDELHYKDVIAKCERAMVDPEFCSLDELTELHKNEYERWSQFCIEGMLNGTFFEL